MPADYQVKPPPGIQELLNQIGKGIGQRLPKNWGFSLMLFPFNESSLFYISNARREDMLKTMEEFIENERKKQ